MQSMQALIIPSHGTPYDSGCFLFHIYIPSTFPNTPPLVKIVTTGNGTVRFNPNLYNCGKVCLSLLGTWRGEASESWNETSSILQVLISIQSLIFIDQPYFNEPGYEHNINTEQGKRDSSKYNQGVQYNTLCWAMVDMIKNPPKGFEDIIRNHFRMKKSHIMNTVHEWLKNSTASTSSSFSNKYNELCNLLCDL
jgi:baculoviral IAP repeat-containing protein 6